MKLAQQISTKSEDFFGAMRSQERLEGEVEQSCLNVKQQRLRLNEIRNRLVGDPLEVMRLFRLRQRYETVLDKVTVYMFSLDFLSLIFVVTGHLFYSKSNFEQPII